MIGLFFLCAPGMARSANAGAVNREAKANREVTRRVQVPPRAVVTGTFSRTARAFTAR
jgi:hypothetical protein